jgi:hypothetical protein
MEVPGRRWLPRPRWRVRKVSAKYLWTGGGMLLLFPYTDSIADYFADVQGWSEIPADATWLLADVLIVMSLFRGTGMRRAAAWFVAFALLLDGSLAVVYHAYYVAASIDRVVYVWLTSALFVLFLVLIAVAMWWRLGKDPHLFRYVLPVVFAIAVAGGADQTASQIACAGYHGVCTGVHEDAHIREAFFEMASQVIPGLLIALAVEARIFTFEGAETSELIVRAAMFRITVIAFAIGCSAALIVVATGDAALPLVFMMTVEALTLGFASILILLPVSPKRRAADPPDDR